jgi:hypothetical protein
MPTDSVAADVARILDALAAEKAWFRHGITDDRLAELTGLPLHRVVAARVEAAAQGLVERRGIGTGRPVTILTPLGVARAQQARPQSA